MSEKTHPFHRDPDFLAKLPLYKTAWFPREDRFVGLVEFISSDDSDVPLLTVQEGDQIWTGIHPTQLESYVL